MQEKKILNAAVRSCNLIPVTKSLWLTHPYLEEMAVKFASFVGPYLINKEGNSLLNSSVENAIEGFQAVMESSGDEQESVARFVKALLWAGVDSFNQQLVAETKRGDVLWSPFVCGAVKFAEDHPDVKLTATRVLSNFQEDIRLTFMMINLIPHSMLDDASLTELLNNVKEPA